MVANRSIRACTQFAYKLPRVVRTIGSEVEKLVLDSQASIAVSPLEFKQVVLPVESTRTPSATHQRATGLFVPGNLTFLELDNRSGEGA